MEDLLYIDDYINIFSKKLNKIIKIKPYKKTLLNSHIIDREKFIKIVNKNIKELNLNNSLFNNKIVVIINMTYTKEDKLLLNNILEELNYRDISFVQEINYLDIDKKSVYINYNDTYFYLYYLNIYGNMQINLYEVSDINKELISIIIKLVNKENLFIYGKNYKELKNILEEEKIDYYYFEESDNYILKKILSKS